MIQIDTNRWRWLQIALMVDLQAIDPTADVENSIKQYRICKPQLMPVKTMTRALWFLQKAGKKLLARKVADLKSCWPQKLLARKVAGLKSCRRLTQTHFLSLGVTLSLSHKTQPIDKILQS